MSVIRAVKSSPKLALLVSLYGVGLVMTAATTIYFVYALSTLKDEDPAPILLLILCTAWAATFIPGAIGLQVCGAKLTSKLEGFDAEEKALLLWGPWLALVAVIILPWILFSFIREVFFIEGLSVIIANRIYEKPLFYLGLLPPVLVIVASIFAEISDRYSRRHSTEYKHSSYYAIGYGMMFISILLMFIIQPLVAKPVGLYVRFFVSVDVLSVLVFLVLPIILQFLWRRLRRVKSAIH
ncbi:MAG: hypothetical protein V1767_07860 [Chloroflexota bacterium]